MQGEINMDKIGFDKISDGAGDISRRGFLQIAGTVAVGVGLGACGKSEKTASRTLKRSDIDPEALPSKGYLLVDTKKCQGGVSCMMACSLAHEGVVNLSLSRIQVLQNPFERFPDDIVLAQCRQCVDPACVRACPEGALYIDKEKGNIRRIDAEKCTGCKSCVEACPFPPARSIWNSRDGKALKCDLCIDAPFWKNRKEHEIQQACVAVCPVAAIHFTTEIPVQQGDIGYDVNLRGNAWKLLGYPTA
jgi:protein NrfC